MEQEQKPVLYWLKLGVSTNGKPAVYEQGGGGDNGGNARVIATLWGMPMRPLKTMAYDTNRCGKHASFRAYKGQYLVDVHIRTNEYVLTVWAIHDFHKDYAQFRVGDDGEVQKLDELEEQLEATIEPLHSIYTESEIDTLPRWIRPAAKAANEKAKCHNCTHTHYVSGIRHWWYFLTQ